MVTAFMAGIHFWWPKITGRMYSGFWSRLVAPVTFIGFNFTFFPQHILGYLGMPRRYHAYPPEFSLWHALSSADAVLLAIGYLMPLVYLSISLVRGQRASSNPWAATGLERQTTSPPPPENFLRPPDVPHRPYAYVRRDQGG
jgi:cytochrome c oxidase subunit I